jgi:hypothetical protein
MRIEGNEQARERARGRARRDTSEQIAMADVNTVERANSDHGA